MYLCVRAKRKIFLINIVLLGRSLKVALVQISKFLMDEIEEVVWF